MAINEKVEKELAYLKNEDPFIRKGAVKSLEQLGDKSVVPALIEVMLNDEKSFVRHAATATFQRKFADKSVVPALIKALKDPAFHVRGAAAAALGVIKDKSAVLPLCAALKDKEDHVRWSAAFPLGKIGDASAVPALRRVINNPKELDHVKNAAKVALKQLEKK